MSIGAETNKSQRGQRLAKIIEIATFAPVKDDVFANTTKYFRQWGVIAKILCCLKYLIYIFVYL